jgi:hypothetical protein
MRKFCFYLLPVAIVAPTVASISPASAGCLNKSTPKGEVHVYVSTAEKDGYRQKGFSDATCQIDLATRKRDVQNMCAIAEGSPKELLDDITKIFGATPAQLCASGKAANEEDKK